MKFLKYITLYFTIVCLTAFFNSCGKKDEPQPIHAATHTLFMYFPWSDNLSSYFETNIENMMTAIEHTGLNSQKVIIYLAESDNSATLYQIDLSRNRYIRNPVKKYTGNPTVSAEGVTSVLNDVKAIAPAEHYAMTIGSHGYGWIPKARSTDIRNARLLKTGVPQWPTRFFGGLSAENQIDIEDFALGVKNANIHFDFILFDDCYMSTVEVAYELRNITDHIVACPSEMMGWGIPYDKVGKHLLGKANLKNVCDGFLSHYESSSTPYALMAMTDCRQLTALANLMKTINHIYAPKPTSTIQNFDGLKLPIFFDLNDYVKETCNDPIMLDAFQKQLSSTVVYEVHTPCYYTNQSGEERIRTCCGMTISDPSINPDAEEKIRTAWWKATH